MALLFAGSLFIVPVGNLYLTFAFVFVVGFFIVPVLPACYQYSAVKLVGQMPPSIVNGFMMSMAMTYSFAASFLESWLLGKD